MRFAPTETLKSDRAVSEELIVRSAVSLSTWEDEPTKATVQEFGRTEIHKDALYALFLTRFSESTGEALGPAGPGGIAEIRSGRLRFIAAEELMRTGEIRTALFTSEPTMEEVRTAVALAEPLTPVPTLDPNSPAVVYGERMTRFADGLQRAASRAEVDALLYELRFQRGQIDDRTVCMKVEAALETEGWKTDLACR